jgi:hypothetical protein
MKVIDPVLLAEFAKPGRCEFCGRSCPSGRDPAHIFSRGAGRVDIACNLVSLCRHCHSMSHAGEVPTRRDLMCIAAMREKMTPEAIRDRVWRLRADRSHKVWNVYVRGGVDEISQPPL